VTTKRSELADVERKLRELAAQGRVDELIALVVELLADAQRSNTALAARLGSALRQLYGRKSAKVSPEQLSLMFDQLGEAAPQSAQDIVAEAASTDEDGAVPQPESKPRPSGHKGCTVPRRSEAIVPS
jgi:transposase